MITLLTGLPGNGKTLFALWYIKAKAEKEKRQVFYHNIKDLTLDWTLMEKAEDWPNCPKGSIIVLDEAQFAFARKPNGSKLPEHYEQLAVHRHKGFDIYLITQHPSLVDNFVRQLVGQHFHTVRKFGLARSTVYEWSSVNASPTSPASQKSSITMKWPYPKEVYGYYKSAEVHTVKRAIPAKIFLALGFVGLVGFGGWWAMQKYADRYKKPDNEASVAQSAGPGAVNVIDAANVAPKNTNTDTNTDRFDAVADAEQYVAMNTPRTVGLPHTAPKYDQLTAPVRVPVPAACIQIGTTSGSSAPRCKCYTQQGTPMDVEYNMCMTIARNGWFQDFNSDPDKGQAKQERSVAVLSNRPDAPMPEHRALPPVASGGPVVVSMAAPSGASEQRAPAIRDDGPPPRSRTAFASNSTPDA